MFRFDQGITRFQDLWGLNHDPFFCSFGILAITLFMVFNKVFPLQLRQLVRLFFGKLLKEVGYFLRTGTKLFKWDIVWSSSLAWSGVVDILDVCWGLRELLRGADLGFYSSSSSMTSCCLSAPVVPFPCKETVLPKFESLFIETENVGRLLRGFQLSNKNIKSRWNFFVNKRRRSP